MSLYTISLFLHIAGALGLFAVLSLEWASVSGMRRARTGAQAAQWIGLQRAGRLMAPSGLTVLLTGIYLAAARWGAPGWVIVALATMLTIVVLGAAVGRRRLSAITRALDPHDGPVSTTLARRLQDPLLERSLRIRSALFLGIVFLMSTKPGTLSSIVVIAVAAIVGVLAGLPAKAPATAGLAPTD